MTLVISLINCFNVVEFVDTDREISDTNNFFEDEPARTYALLKDLCLHIFIFYFATFTPFNVVFTI